VNYVTGNVPLVIELNLIVAYVVLIDSKKLFQSVYVQLKLMKLKDKLDAQIVISNVNLVSILPLIVLNVLTDTLTHQNVQFLHQVENLPELLTCH
jgi:fumarate reductase subunit C